MGRQEQGSKKAMPSPAPGVEQPRATILKQPHGTAQAECVESSFAKKDVRILVDKLNATQQCIPVAKQAKHMLGCISKSVAEESNSSPLFRAYEIHSTWSTV